MRKAVVSLFVCFVLLAGCLDGDNGDDEGLTGTWENDQGEQVTFLEDGNFSMDTVNYSYTGTYKRSGGMLTLQFTSPFSQQHVVSYTLSDDKLHIKDLLRNGNFTRVS